MESSQVSPPQFEEPDNLPKSKVFISFLRKRKRLAIIISSLVIIATASLSVYSYSLKQKQKIELHRSPATTTEVAPLDPASTPTPSISLPASHSPTTASKPGLTPTNRPLSSTTPTLPPGPADTPVPNPTSPPQSVATSTPAPPTATPTTVGCTPVTFAESKNGSETTITLTGAWWLNVKANPTWSSVDYDTNNKLIFLHFTVPSGTISIYKGGYDGAPLCQTYNWPN